jgi:hypothetical protein
MTAADMLRAYSHVIKGSEEARMLHEQAEWLRLETLKKRAETRLYLESITPSWSQRQAKIDQDVLAHALDTTNPSEISSGAALNVLLRDLRKQMGKKASSSPITLGEEVLKHINIAARENHGSPALLRNDGRFTWPQALTRDEISSPEERADIAFKARDIWQHATRGNVSRKALADLSDFFERTAEKLLHHVNDISTSEYLEAKRFLQDFAAARTALGNGEAAGYIRFQNWVRDGKTIQEVVDYMVHHGLTFAPGVPGDESAYRALHSALAACVREGSRYVTGASLAAKERD